MTTLNGNWRRCCNRFRGMSISIGLFVVFASTLRSYPNDQGLPANRRVDPSGTSPERQYLGVWLENTRVFFSGYGWVDAVKITAVDPGSPARSGRTCIGRRRGLERPAREVWRFEEFQKSVAHANGTISLSIIKADTRRYITLPPIPLAVLHAQPPAPTSPARTAPIQGPYTYSRSLPIPRPSYSPEMHKKAQGKAAATKKDSPPVDQSDDVPGVGDVAESAPSVLRSFPQPPPKASSWTTLKPELLHQPGQRASLRDVSHRIEAAFRKAGYVEWSYYAVPKGFALVSQLEQFQLDGTPLKEPDRWSVSVSAPRVFSLESYIKALFSAAAVIFGSWS